MVFNFSPFVSGVWYKERKDTTHHAPDGCEDENRDPRGSHNKFLILLLLNWKNFFMSILKNLTDDLLLSYFEGSVESAKLGKFCLDLLEDSEQLIIDHMRNRHIVNPNPKF